MNLLKDKKSLERIITIMGPNKLKTDYMLCFIITGGGCNVKNLSIVDNWANSSI